VLAWLAAAVVLVVAIALVAGRSGGSSGDSGVNATSGSPAIAPGPAQAGSGNVAPVPSAKADSSSGSSESSASSGSGSDSDSSSSGSSAPGGSPTAPRAASRSAVRLVQTGSVQLEVRKGEVGRALDRLQATATGLGGYVSDSRSEQVGIPSGTVTLRVPVASFGKLRTEIGRVGTIVSSSTSSRDVTGEYVDLEARVKALKTTRNTYLTLLSKAATIGDTLSVQQRIDDVQTQIEQLEGQRTLLADQSDLATLQVQVSEKGAPSVAPPSSDPDSGFSGALRRAWHRFTDGLESIIAASGTFLLLLIVGVVLWVAGRFAYRRYRRRMV
jgi:hypothetical protein